MAFLLQHRVKNSVFSEKKLRFWKQILSFLRKWNQKLSFSSVFLSPDWSKALQMVSKRLRTNQKTQKLSFCQPEDIHCRSHLQNRLSDRVWEVILVNISRNLLLNGFQPWMERVENNHTNHDRKIKAVDWCRCSTQLKDRTLFCVSWAILTQSKPLFDSMFCNSVNVT